MDQASALVSPCCRDACSLLRLCGRASRRPSALRRTGRSARCIVTAVPFRLGSPRPATARRVAEHGPASGHPAGGEQGARAYLGRNQAARGLRDARRSGRTSAVSKAAAGSSSNRCVSICARRRRGRGQLTSRTGDWSPPRAAGGSASAGSAARVVQQPLVVVDGGQAGACRRLATARRARTSERGRRSVVAPQVAQRQCRGRCIPAEHAVR